MKIINLLNKIANGDEVPRKISYNNIIYNWDGDGYLHYKTCYSDERAFLEGIRTDMVLNDEIEIIEEDTTKGIEKISDIGWYSTSARGNDTISKDKINEIIDKINELEK